MLKVENVNLYTCEVNKLINKLSLGAFPLYDNSSIGIRSNLGRPARFMRLGKRIEECILGNVAFHSYNFSLSRGS